MDLKTCRNILCLLIVGCGTEEDIDVQLVSARTDAVINGENAWAFEAQRATFLGGCTSTLIGRRYVLTAAHCYIPVGENVYFFAGLSLPDFTKFRRIDAVIRPPCVTTSHRYNCSGQFADIAIVKLYSQIDPYWTQVKVASMAWRYPGGTAPILKVGNGQHDGVDFSGRLKWVMDTTWSRWADNGGFLSDRDQLNPGDSGGPAYYEDKILGVVYDKGWNWEGAKPTNTYTEIPTHLDWILQTIEYTTQAPLYYYDFREKPFTSTNHVNSWTGMSRVRCEYACDKTSNCQMYSFTPTNTRCDLYSAKTYDYVYSPGAQVGYRY